MLDGQRTIGLCVRVTYRCATLQRNHQVPPPSLCIRTSAIKVIFFLPLEIAVGQLLLPSNSYTTPLFFFYPVNSVVLVVLPSHLSSPSRHFAHQPCLVYQKVRASHRHSISESDSVIGVGSFSLFLRCADRHSRHSTTTRTDRCF
jgi:hypothetical protein